MMGYNDDKMKCICCDKEQQVLVSVEMESNSIFTHRRGVCQKCLKDKDINNICTEFEIRNAEKTIEESRNRIEEMKKHIARLNDVSKQEGVTDE
jgi:Zn-dependent alcohol dehydrogenase